MHPGKRINNLIQDFWSVLLPLSHLLFIVLIQSCWSPTNILKSYLLRRQKPSLDSCNADSVACFQEAQQRIEFSGGR